MVDEKLRGIFLVCYENFQRSSLPLLFVERTSPHAGKLNFPKEAALVRKALWCTSIHIEDENVLVILLWYTSKFIFYLQMLLIIDLFQYKESQ